MKSGSGRYVWNCGNSPTSKVPCSGASTKVIVDDRAPSSITSPEIVNPIAELLTSFLTDELVNVRQLPSGAKVANEQYSTVDAGVLESTETCIVRALCGTSKLADGCS